MSLSLSFLHGIASGVKTYFNLNLNPNQDPDIKLYSKFSIVSDAFKSTNMTDIVAVSRNYAGDSSLVQIQKNTGAVNMMLNYFRQSTTVAMLYNFITHAKTMEKINASKTVPIKAIYDTICDTIAILAGLIDCKVKAEIEAMVLYVETVSVGDDDIIRDNIQAICNIVAYCRHNCAIQTKIKTDLETLYVAIGKTITMSETAR